MPGKYHTHGTDTAEAALSVVSVISATTTQPEIHDVVMSSSSAPADQTVHYQWRRFSADGTGTAVTPTPLDFNGPASLATSKENYTITPSLTAGEMLLNVAHNLRASPRWIASPGFQWRIPALAGDGICQNCVAVSGTLVAETTILFLE